MIIYKDKRTYQDRLKKNPDMNKENHLRRIKNNPNYCKESYAKTMKRNPNANKEQYKRRKENNLYTIRVSSKLQNYKMYDHKHYPDDIITTKVGQLREVFENGKCCYCGENNKFELGLDRIDNKKSHKLENTVIACGICNKMRGVMKQEDFIKYIVPGILEWKNAGGVE